MHIRYKGIFTAGLSALEKRLLPSYVWTSDPLTLWRERILFIICFIAAVLGPIALIPSLLLSYREGLWVVILVDSLAYMAAVTILIARNASFVVRALVICSIFYALGVCILFILGPVGAGYIWLFGASVLVSTFIGLGAAIWTLVFNTIAMLSVGFFIAYGNPEWILHMDNALEKWLVMSTNFLLLNAIVTITTAVLLNGLKTALLTEQKISKSLRESEERFRQIYEHMAVGVAQVSLDSRFERVNRAYCQMMGYDEEELIGRHIRDITQPEFVEENLRLQSQLAAGEIDHYRMEKGYVHKNGCIVYGILDSCLVHDLEGKPSCSLGSIMDITARKRAEEEKRSLEERMQRAEKMEALGQLAGGVAHDLNNVLGVLSGYSELLLVEIPEGSRSRGHVEKILQSTGKGAAIIQDMLTLARRGVTAAEVVNLNAVVEGFLKTPVFENIKDYHPRVIFRTEIDRRLLNIRGSALHLEKTVMNLVSNAAEAISGVGEVTIRTENRYLDKPLRGYDEVKEGDYVVLNISDTGMGIPAENIEKIFEPFYTKKTMGRSGTGLGLAIVWGTVKDNNGYIDVQSKVDEGTTFTLYFPVTREEPAAQMQQAPIEQYMGKGEAVLVVDDIAEQRDIASRLLTRLGYEVHVVTSGEEAVEYLKENKADILVLDMIMAPGIDGLETYQRVLEVNPKQKAIIVSGFSETERAKEAQRLGAGAYVKKPYILEKIGVAIRDELKR